jgi:hypothetical protein
VILRESAEGDVAKDLLGSEERIPNNDDWIVVEIQICANRKKSSKSMLIGEIRVCSRIDLTKNPEESNVSPGFWE